jgi:hypothetical protein
MARRFTHSVTLYHTGSQHGRGSTDDWEVVIRQAGEPTPESIGKRIDALFPTRPWPGPNVMSRRSGDPHEVHTDDGLVWEVTVAVTTRTDSTE